MLCRAFAIPTPFGLCLARNAVTIDHKFGREQTLTSSDNLIFLSKSALIRVNPRPIARIVVYCVTLVWVIPKHRLILLSHYPNQHVAE
jgi:hypothetical protein